MHRIERENTILRLLSMRNYLHINDLVEATGASEATLRRDFLRMEVNNKIRRVRGGIELIADGETSNSSNIEPPFLNRMNINREQKRKIAKKACEMISEGEVIMIDGGTTPYYMVEFIPQFNFNVVTHSLAVAEYLIKYSNCVVSLPEGNIDPTSMLLLNNLNPDPFINYNTKKVSKFITTSQADAKIIEELRDKGIEVVTV